MEFERNWKDYSDEEKYLSIKSYLKGMVKLDDGDVTANKQRLEWIREHLPAYKVSGNEEKNYVFISYSHRDYEKVYSDLAYFCYNPNKRVRFWYDEGLPLGKEWDKAARKLMSSSRCVGVIFYLSKNLLLSKSVLKEIEMVKEFDKYYFAVALEPGGYSAENIFDGVSYGELHNAYGNDNEIDKTIGFLKTFFPDSKTALSMSGENAEARIAKIAENLNVTEEVFSDFVTEKIQGGLRIVDYRGNKTDVIIPSLIYDKPVTEISCGFNTAVKIQIPAGVRKIDTEKFIYADNLEEIKVDGKNKYYRDICGVLCAKDLNAIVRVPINWNWKKQFSDEKMWEADFSHLSGGIKTMGFQALRSLMTSNCSVPIEDPLENSYNEALCCEKYEMNKDDFKALFLKLSKDINTNDKFKICTDTGLKRYTITKPTSSALERNILEESFYVTYSSAQKRYKVYSLAKELSVFNGIERISEYAFKGCRNIDYLFLPDSITNISKYAFTDSSVKLIFLPEKLEKINDGLFYNCKNLNTVLTITDNINCGKEYGLIRETVIGGKISYIGANAFGNTFISNVVLGNSVKSIGDCAFKNCGYLFKINIPQSVESIGDNAFENCMILNTLTISEGVKNIGLSCFKNCIYLQNINLPSTIDSLDYSVFSGCFSIKQIKFSNTKNVWLQIWNKGLSAFLNLLFGSLNGKDYIKTDDCIPPNLKSAQIICTDGVFEPSVS